MSKTLNSPVTIVLAQASIPYEVIEIPLSEDSKPIRNLEGLMTQQGLNPQSIVRSILFKTASDTFVLLAAAGGARADWAVLRKHLDTRKCRMAELNEVQEATGYVVGAVPPIALPEDLKVLVDDGVKKYPKVVIGSGVLGFAISLESADLLKLLHNADVGKFTGEVS